MKAVLFNEFGGPEVLSVKEVAQPEPAANEVSVRNRAAGINPKDIMVRKGKFKFFTGSKFPLQMGYDFAGVIEHSNGHNDLPIGAKVFGMLNSWKAGAYAQIVNVPVDELAPLPKGIDFEQAAGVPLVALTALQAIRDLGKLKPGQKILINGGSGGVGTAAIQIAKAMNAEVTSISSEKNFDLCRSLGADVCLSYKDHGIEKIEDTYDLFFDVFGNQSFPKSKRLLKQYGRFVGTIPNPKLILQQFLSGFGPKKANLVIVKSKAADLKLIADWIENGQFRPVVDQVLPLEAVQDGHRYLETKRARGKVILRIPE
ncbi:MAG: NAD(P)-dependent alcohol dehydrogenase [Bacteroidota bacterium]